MYFGCFQIGAVMNAVVISHTCAGFGVDNFQSILSKYQGTREMDCMGRVWLALYERTIYHV